MTGKKVLILLGSVCLAVMLVVACAGPAPTPTPTPPEVIKWRYNTPYTPKEHIEVGMVKLIEEVAKRTDGRFIIEPHWSDELGYLQKDLPHIMGTGILEMSHLQIVTLSPQFPWVGAISLPFVIPKGNDQKIKSIEASRPIIEELLQEHDLKHLAWGTHPCPYTVIFFREAKPMTVEDFEGLKIRVWAKEQELFLQKLGASGLFIPIAEVFLAMQTGVVDGMFGGLGAFNITARHYEEISKTCLMLYQHSTNDSQVVSQKAFDELPEAFQAILMDCAQEYQADLWENYVLDPAYWDEAWSVSEEAGIENYWAEDEFYEKAESFGAEVANTWLQGCRDFSPAAGEKGEEYLRALAEALGGASAKLVAEFD